jgi:hypothetical protein
MDVIGIQSVYQSDQETPTMPEIEFLTLANHVEALNGLLYVSGGGWTDHWRPLQSANNAFISHLGIGVSVLFPWGDTNVPYQLVVNLETDDGNQLFDVRPILNVGRPAGLPPGSDQRAVFAFNAEMVFPQAGGYRIIARIENVEGQRAVTFRVHDVAGMPGIVGPAIPPTLPAG